VGTAASKNLSNRVVGLLEECTNIIDLEVFMTEETLHVGHPQAAKSTVSMAAEGTDQAVEVLVEVFASDKRFT
jgi:hypothetical protein